MTDVLAREFRGLWEHDYCHSCVNCSRWPNAGRYESSRTGLGSAERCSERRVKTHKGNCRTGKVGA